uniref:uncharacterized protein LOC122773764 isoform X1 n=1 Tax=Solea senegalensis TaxID=28829 RepID=UPI001CD81F1B|nr:uncharacterized protein LOC122773764 isoform X1 [Solea senegalensis]
MTTLTFIFLTLLTWTVLSGSWLSLNCLKLRLSSHDDETKSFSSSALYQNAVIHTLQLTVTCERFLGMRDVITEDCTSMFVSGCVNTCKRVQDAVSEEEQHRKSCKSDIQQLWVCFQSKSSCLSHRTQIMSKVNATLCSMETFLTQAGNVNSGWPYASTWKVDAGFLATVLLFGTYMKRMILSANSVPPGSDSNSTMMMLLIMTLHRFSPSVIIQQLCEWPYITVVISCALCLSYVLIRTANVSLACKVAWKMMKVLCLLQQRLWTLSFTVMFVWFTCSLLFLNKNMKLWIEDKDVGSTLRYRALLELLVTLYCMFILLPSLLQFILMKLNFLSVHLHVQLVTCLQNSRVPTKYVLVMKIHRFI